MRILLLGSTGTIGASTLRALIAKGHAVTCIVRTAHPDSPMPTGVAWVYADPCQPNAWPDNLFDGEPFDAVISCMASRTGHPKDAWAVDHDAHLAILNTVKAAGIGHFILLSAICVQKPQLAFQKAKRAFESALIASGLNYSIVRPTAFFKSLSGQLERVRRGHPFLVFGDGQLTACKPISDDDLADFIAGCLTDVSRHRAVLPIGGPGPAITPLDQAEAIFAHLGQPLRIKRVPIRLLDSIIWLLTTAGRVIPAAAAKGELAKIGRYYATESMLVWDATQERYDSDKTPSHGKETLFDAYARWLDGETLPKRGDHAVF